jgi:hypothetical protein
VLRNNFRIRLSHLLQACCHQADVEATVLGQPAVLCCDCSALRCTACAALNAGYATAWIAGRGSR